MIGRIWENLTRWAPTSEDYHQENSNWQTPGPFLLQLEDLIVCGSEVPPIATRGDHGTDQCSKGAEFQRREEVVIFWTNWHNTNKGELVLIDWVSEWLIINRSIRPVSSWESDI